MPRAVSPMKLPWEVNPWLGAVMGAKKDYMALPTPRPYDFSSRQDESIAGDAIDVSGVVRKRRKKSAPWQAMVDHPRQVALEAWLHLLLDYPGSRVGEQLKQKQDKSDRIQVLRDTVEHKATGTLRIRALDLKRFISWAEKYGKEMSQITEEDGYGYVVWLRQMLAAPTAASRFKEAVTFAHHVMGWPVEEGALGSKRVMGVGTSMMKGLDKVKRAAPFPPRFVLRLEDIMQDVGQPTETRYHVGVILFQLYSRFRFGDLQGVQKEPWWEHGNLVTEVSDYKTKMARDRRGTKLPVVAIGQGLHAQSHAQSWAIQFQAVRRVLNLELPSSGVFLPVLDGSEPTQQSLTTTDQTKFIRRFVVQAILEGVLPSDTDADMFSSHSCKRTLLHWAAADGLSLDDRRLLGNHVLRSDGSWIAYSVDGLRGPIVSVSRTIQKVSQGELEVTGERIQPRKEERLDESSEDSAEVGDEQSSGEETKELAQLVPQQVDAEEVALQDFDIYQHNKYNTFHLRRRRVQQQLSSLS
eukprot:6492644-Amphidinium_carterae.1